MTLKFTFYFLVSIPTCSWQYLLFWGVKGGLRRISFTAFMQGWLKTLVHKRLFNKPWVTWSRTNLLDGYCCSNKPKFALVPPVLHFKRSCLFKRYETESPATYVCRKITTLDTGVGLLGSVSCNYTVISHLALHFSSFLSPSVFVQCKKCTVSSQICIKPSKCTLVWTHTQNPCEVQWRDV